MMIAAAMTMSHIFLVWGVRPSGEGRPLARAAPVPLELVRRGPVYPETARLSTGLERRGLRAGTSRRGDVNRAALPKQGGPTVACQPDRRCESSFPRLGERLSTQPPRTAA
jgi:hypothetical protein